MSTFTVTNTKAAGAGSLAQALDDAAAHRGFDTVTFAKGLSGSTIHLAQTLVLAQSVFIDGDLDDNGKADIRLSGDTDKDGDGDIRIVTVASGNTVVLEGLGFVDGRDMGAEDGDAGSAIYNKGKLRIVSSDFVDNFAHGKDGTGASAGTVLSLGSLDIVDSRFIDNTAIGGSGMPGRDAQQYSYGGTYIYDGHPGYGGGTAATAVVQWGGGTFTFDRITSSGGHATGGAGGTGGKGGPGYSSLQSGYGGDGGYGGNAAVVASAANISGTLTLTGKAAVFTGGQGGHGGVPGTDRGGGSGSAGATGQDGEATPFIQFPHGEGLIDTVLLVTTAKDAGVGSLRYALDHAHDGDVVEFAGKLAGKTINLESPLTISREIQIRGDVDGDGRADITLSGDSDKDGAGDVQILSIAADAILELDSMTLEKGLGNEGGAIFAAEGSHLYVNDSTIRDSVASKGGALFAAGGLTLSRSTIHSNSADYGGAIYVRSGNDITLLQTTITGNRAAVGGGIDTGAAAVVRVNASTIVGNDASQYAGGIDAFGGTQLIVDHSIISGNTSIEIADMGGTTTHDIRVNFSIIGNQATTDAAETISRTDNPRLGELLDNGGSVLTLAPLDGSLAATVPPDETIGAQAYFRNQLIVGTDAANHIIGGRGDDTMRGGLGKDTLDGGKGIDVADYSDKSKAVSLTLKGSKSADVRINGITEDKIKGVEHVIGGAGADRLAGDKAANLLVGNAGKDVLAGGAGKDTLIGGTGKDTLTGGAADDSFIFNRTKDSPAGNKADVVTDFDALGMGDDRLDLSSLTGMAGPKLKYMAENPFTDVGQVRVKADGHDVIVEVNLTGNDDADFAIRLLDAKLTDMGKGDFIL